MWKMLLIALVTALAVLAADSIHKLTVTDTRAGAVEASPWTLARSGISPIAR